MVLRVGSDLSAVNLLRTQSDIRELQADTLQNLATGTRVQEYADDPGDATLISDFQLRLDSFHRKQQALQKNLAVLQKADAALSGIGDLIVRARALLVEDDPDPGNLAAREDELQRILDGIDRIAGTLRIDGKTAYDPALAKDAQFRTNPSEVGARSISIGRLSRLEAGPHYLSTANIGTVKSKNTDGMIGEFGLITDEPGDDTNPVYSPDGEKILYLADNTGVETTMYERHERDTGVGTNLEFGGTSPGVESNLAYTFDGDIVFNNGGATKLRQGAAISTVGIGTPTNNVAANPAQAEILFETPEPLGLGLNKFTLPVGGPVTIEGMASNGANLFVVDSAGDRIVEVSSAGALVNSYSTAAITETIYGLAHTSGSTFFAITGDDPLTTGDNRFLLELDLSGGVTTEVNRFDIGPRVIPPGGTLTNASGTASVTVDAYVYDKSLIQHGDKIIIEWEGQNSFRVKKESPLGGGVTTITTGVPFTSGVANTDAISGTTWTITDVPTPGFSEAAATPPPPALNRHRMAVRVDGVDREVTFDGVAANDAAIDAVIDAQAPGLGTIYQDSTPGPRMLTSMTTGVDSEVIITNGQQGGTSTSAADLGASLSTSAGGITLETNGSGPVFLEIGAVGSTADLITALQTAIDASALTGQLTVTQLADGRAQIETTAADQTRFVTVTAGNRAAYHEGAAAMPGAITRAQMEVVINGTPTTVTIAGSGGDAATLAQITAQLGGQATATQEVGGQLRVTNAAADASGSITVNSLGTQAGTFTTGAAAGAASIRRARITVDIDGLGAEEIEFDYDDLTTPVGTPEDVDSGLVMTGDLTAQALQNVIRGLAANPASAYFGQAAASNATVTHDAGSGAITFSSGTVGSASSFDVTAAAGGAPATVISGPGAITGFGGTVTTFRGSIQARLNGVTQNLTVTTAVNSAAGLRDALQAQIDSRFGAGKAVVAYTGANYTVTSVAGGDTEFIEFLDTGASGGTTTSNNVAAFGSHTFMRLTAQVNDGAGGVTNVDLQINDGGAAMSATRVRDIINAAAGVPIAVTTTGTNWTFRSENVQTDVERSYVTITPNADTIGKVAGAAAAATDLSALVLGGATSLDLTVTVDGNPATNVDLMLASGYVDETSVDSGAKIALRLEEAIQEQIGGGADIVDVSFIPGDQHYEITSKVAGESSQVVVTTGAVEDVAATLKLTVGAGATLTRGVSDAYNLFFTGGAPTEGDGLAALQPLLKLGELAHGAVHERGASNAAVSLDIAAGAGRVDGYDDAAAMLSVGPVGTTVIGLDNLAGAGLLQLGGDERFGYDDAAGLLNFGVGNGGAEEPGKSIYTGDTYEYIIQGDGVNPQGIAYDGSRLLIVDPGLSAQGKSRIDYYNPATGAKIFDLPLPFQVTDPRSIEVLPSGNLALSDVGVNNYELDTSGQIVNFIQQPGTGRDVRAQAQIGGVLYVANATDGEIYELDITQQGTGVNIFKENLGTNEFAAITNFPGDPTAPPLHERTPRYSADGMRVVYAIEDPATGLFDIGVSDNTGIMVSTLDVDLADNPNARLNRNGNKVVYESAGDLIVSNVDGSGAVVFAGAKNGSFSPVDDRLVYERGPDVFVQADDGSGAPIQINTQIFAANAAQPSWNPDGSTIVFSADGPNGDKDIWVSNADDGTPLGIPQPAGFYEIEPYVEFDNTVVHEIFTFTMVQDNDGESFDIFEVVSSKTGKHQDLVVGELWTSDTGDLAPLGAGLTLQVRNDGQFAVGDSFQVETDQVPMVALDDGPFKPIKPDQSFFIENAQGEGVFINFDFNIPLGDRSALVMITPRNQTHGDSGASYDDVAFLIEPVTTKALKLEGLSVTDAKLTKLLEPVLTTAGTLELAEEVTFDVTKMRREPESYTLTFVDDDRYTIFGQASGALALGDLYEPGKEITFAGITLKLQGTAQLGDTVKVTVDSFGSLDKVDRALSMVTGDRTRFAGYLENMESQLRQGRQEVAALTNNLRTIQDADYGQMLADKVRNELRLRTTEVGLKVSNFTRAQFASFLLATLV